jgi:carbonic anhydrase
MTTTAGGTRLSADEALGRLIEGNQRFLGASLGIKGDFETFTDLAKAQSPYATVLGCSDSRVPPELISLPARGNCSSSVAGNVLRRKSLERCSMRVRTWGLVVRGPRPRGLWAIAAAMATKHEGEHPLPEFSCFWRASSRAFRILDPTPLPTKRRRSLPRAMRRWTVCQILIRRKGKRAWRRVS